MLKLDTLQICLEAKFVYVLFWLIFHYLEPGTQIFKSLKRGVNIYLVDEHPEYPGEVSRSSYRTQ